MSHPPHEEPGQPALDLSAQPLEPESAPNPADSAGKGKAGRVSGAPVFVYLAIMFAAAFLLLLMAYLMQEHTSQNVIADLQQSLDSSMGSLTEENRALRTELENLLTQVDTLQEQLDASESGYLALEGKNQDLILAQNAILTLAQLEHLVSTEQYVQAQALLDAQGEVLAPVLMLVDDQQAGFRLSGQPTLSQRLDAAAAALAEQAAPQDP